MTEPSAETKETSNASEVSEVKQDEVKHDSGDNLDQLLAEFEKYRESTAETQSMEEEKSSDADDDQFVKKSDLDKILEKEIARKQTLEKTEKDVELAVKAVKGDLNFPDHYVRAILEAEAQKSDKFRNAFFYRDKNPEAWKKILEAKSKEFKKFFETKVDKSATESSNAIESAMRNATTKDFKDEETDVFKMTQRQFEEYKAKKFKRS